MTYFNKYCNKAVGAPLPKFIHYCAHDDCLGLFFEGLGLHTARNSPPGSALFFEFF